MYRRIVVPVQGDGLDKHAIDLAASISGRTNMTDLTLLYVVEVPQHLPLDADLPGKIELGETILERSADYARSSGLTRWQRVTTELLQARSASAAIVDEAIERGADAIVLATVNRQKLGVLSQGETMPYVMRNAPCDVIVVRTLAENGGLS